MMYLSTSVVGLASLEAKLAALDAALKVPDILDEAEAVLLNRIRTRFLAETDPDGKKWEPSKAALKRKAGGYTWSNGRKVTGTGTLFASGVLFHSIQAFASSPTSRDIATDVPYARRHQYGIGVEVRPFLGFSDLDGKVIERLIALRVQGIL